MPKSKSKRGKAYRPKAIALPLHFSPAKLEEIESMIANVETRVLLKIKTGECEVEEMRGVRDVLNIALFAMVHRQKGFKDYPLEEIAEQIVQAGVDTARVIERAKKLGRVVCTGDEMGSILDTLEACVRFCREQLEQCPGIFAVEINAAKMMTSTHEGRVTVSKKSIDWVFDRAMQITHARPEARARLFAELTEQARRHASPVFVPA